MRLESASAFRHGIALFPGHPGILKLHEVDGEPRFELRGNFLVRSRRHWLDEETLVVVLDAPSDEWNDFSQYFRHSARYGSDVARLLAEVSARYPVESWTFIGTSEGSVSAFHAARMNPQLARRVILSASLLEPTRSGPGLSAARFDELSMPLLWVHHAEDPCRFTPYHQARRYAERTMSPLLTVRGGGPEKGDPCQAFTFHGFVGRERDLVLAMRGWVKTGRSPLEIP
jgi:pimeloyl-ACP methyl ester carboxylesterase